METSAPKRKRPGSKYCCVVGCHNSVANTKGKEPIVKFYSFPGKWYETDRREAWIRAVRRKKWAKRNRSAARNLTSPHPPEESSPVDALSNASEADCSPEADAQSKALEQGSLLLTEVEVDAQQFTLTCVALMLSATDGTHGSTQVTHVAQADKVIFFLHSKQHTFNSFGGVTKKINLQLNCAPVKIINLYALNLPFTPVTFGTELHSSQAFEFVSAVGPQVLLPNEPDLSLELV
ncbi:hypothetical protein HPB48_009120 [Haemaphysalis longicornis]|uniref:THAP-type domain-containing protein n=1 Tax=Haemaphysalis longicornis TaxID=44386 RepID=A0A9J6GY06_HAELO|nr:hypothetical protein HPB48_009120 [Haemaphysalis longicornis]